LFRRSLVADGHCYGDWVADTQQVLASDPPLPVTGARLQVRVGVGSLPLDDICVVRIREPQRRLELEAMAGFFDAARIALKLTP
jgi:hypothetical protein